MPVLLWRRLPNCSRWFDSKIGVSVSFCRMLWEVLRFLFFKEFMTWVSFYASLLSYSESISLNLTVFVVPSLFRFRYWPKTKLSLSKSIEFNYKVELEFCVWSKLLWKILRFLVLFLTSGPSPKLNWTNFLDLLVLLIITGLYSDLSRKSDERKLVNCSYVCAKYSSFLVFISLHMAILFLHFSLCFFSDAVSSFLIMVFLLPYF